MCGKIDPCFNGLLHYRYPFFTIVIIGRKIYEILANMNMVAEGVKTAQAVYQICLKHGVEMPISKAVYDVLYNDKDPRESVTELMTRDLITE